MRALRWTVPIFLLILTVYWVMALFLIAVDPLDLYPWGPQPRRAATALAQVHEDLIPGMISDPAVDLLLVGGSTTGHYTPAQLRSWIPGVRNPANISYNSPRPGDTSLVMDYIDRRSHARRLLMVYNTFYSLPTHEVRPGFETFLFTGTLSDSVRALSPQVIKDGFDVLRGRPLYAGSNADTDDHKRRDKNYRSFQTRHALEKLAVSLRRGQTMLAAPAPQDCSAYPGITQQLAPFARRMAAKGVRVDIMMPTYSSAFFGVLRADPANTVFNTNFMERDLTARRCLVEELDGTPSVRVVSFEGERWITDDLGNYHDIGHLHSDKIAEFMFRHLDSDEYRLTRANIGAYVDDLRHRARTYQPYSTVIGYGHAS